MTALGAATTTPELLGVDETAVEAAGLYDVCLALTLSGRWSATMSTAAASHWW